MSRSRRQHKGRKRQQPKRQAVTPELRELQRESWPCICGAWHPLDQLCPDGGWWA